MRRPEKRLRRRCSLVAACALAACHPVEAPSPPLPPTVARPPVRGAAGDTDLRVMLAEIASSRACESIEGQYVGLPAADRPRVVTGVLWIRHCKITSDGTRVGFEIAGNGWQWASLSQHQAGGRFAVRQYVKFEVHAKVRGSIDLAYDRAAHVLSIWFSPTGPPVIEFHPVGDVEVDSKGLWSSVIGGVASILSASPDEQGEHAARRQGTRAFEATLAEGLTFATDLCTGDQRATLGRVAKGSMGAAGVGQTRRVSIELEPGGLMVFGPLLAPGGMRVDIDSDGPVHVGLACADDVAAAADAFVRDRRAPRIPMLGQADVDGHGTIDVARTSCRVAVVARSIRSSKVTFAYARAPGEQARSTGGPIIRCER